MKIAHAPRPLTVVEKDPMYSGLLRTARNKAAITVDLSGKALTLAQARARAWARRKGYSFHYQRTADGSVAMWLERKGRRKIHEEEDAEEVVYGEDAGTHES